jgi:ABC-type nitrate/sulfonate/bicarbonate transport system permease component
MEKALTRTSFPAGARPAAARLGGAPSLLWLTALGTLAFFGLWSGLAVSGIVPRAFLPTPWEVGTTFVRLLHEPFVGFTLWQHMASSLQRFAMGFGLAVLVGVPLGLLMGWYRWAEDIVTPLFEAIRYVAPIAWVPFAALWFGTGIGGPVMIIFFGAFAPCLLNAYRGAKLVDPTLIEASRMLGIKPVRMFTDVLWPASIPSIVAGLRIAAGLGWQSLVGAELIVASSGVGYLMVKGQAAVNTSIVMSGMLAIGAVGIVIDVVLRRFEAAVNRRRGRG